MDYKTIRENYQSKDMSLTIVDRYCMLVSPLYTKQFIKRKIIPNSVTVLMILSGILGGFIFFSNNIVLKILGIFFIHSWYILDCSDGEVARITKKYSLFGKELDYMAHVINHPIFLISYAVTLNSIYETNSFYIIFFIICACDMLNRQILALEIVYDFKVKNTKNNQDFKYVKSLKADVISFFANLPNFILFFPIVYIIDIVFNSHFTIVYVIVQLMLIMLITVRHTFKFVNKIRVM